MGKHHKRKAKRKRQEGQMKLPLNKPVQGAEVATVKKHDHKHDHPSAKGYTCYTKHPALPVGDGKVVYGGNCGHPVVTDADVYVGLDAWSAKQPPYPWDASDGHVVFTYKITDMAAPANPDSFMQLIAWLSAQIDLGKKVHVGCIGGHGRTGVVLAALVAYRKVHENPIKYVREMYCHKAVESLEQIKFLKKHFDCPEVPPSKKPIADRDDDLSYKGFTSSSGSSWKKGSHSGGNFGKADIDSGTPQRQVFTVWGPQVSWTHGK